MKTTLKIATLLFLIPAALFAAIPGQIGTVTALRGDVNITRGIALYQAHKGLDIQKKDSFFTSKNGSMQITFSDNTVITLGKNTVFKVEEYLYNEQKRKDSKVTFKFRKGFFKSITGRIGKISAKKFKIQTKNSTIGVRGTEITGTSTNVKENIVCTKGEIVVKSEKKEFIAKENQKIEIKLDPNVDYIVAKTVDVLLQEQVRLGMKTPSHPELVNRPKEELTIVYKPEVKKAMIKKGIKVEEMPVIRKDTVIAPETIQEDETELLDEGFILDEPEFKTQPELREEIEEFSKEVEDVLIEEKKKDYYKPKMPQKFPEKEPKRQKDEIIEDIEQIDQVMDTLSSI